MRKYILLLSVLAVQTAMAQSMKKDITFDALFKNRTFAVKSVPMFNTMKDGETYSQLVEDKGRQSIQTFSLQNGKLKSKVFDNYATLFNSDTLRIQGYEFSKDEKQLLLFTEAAPIYRHSILYKVYIYDIAKKKLSLLSEDKVLHASLSPNNQYVAYVKDNNLYYKVLAGNTVVQVTADGRRNAIINGNCDWVYEEEFAFSRAYEWSPNSDNIAFYRFDESKVKEASFPVYGDLYPHNYTFKYPKAGEDNSVVEIKIYSLKNKTAQNISLGANTDQYIPRIKWTSNPDELCVYRLNRLQNKLDLLLANSVSGKSDIIYTEENKYYIDINDNIRFLSDKESFIFSSEQSGYNQLFKWNWKRQELTRLSDGNFDIEELVGVNEKEKMVYYTAAVNSPAERRLYSVDFKGENTKCLTNAAGFHAISPCEGQKYFLVKHSTIKQVPDFYLIDANGRKIRTLENNKALQDSIQEYNLGEIKLTKFKGVQDSLHAWMITPPGFDAAKKYPVLMFQYSGPNSQQVQDAFPVRDYFWHQMLAQKGYIIVCVDGTGTGFRGEEFRKKTYLQLGKLESDDQIAVAKELGKLAYVDKNRIGIWGWSYGGFMSSICILKGSDVFKTAIAVAPVTNWRYYDNVYTERYMRTPQENPTGYDENAPESMAKQLKGNFLLIHGTADDNVHFQNAVMLTDALIKANKDFESTYYPNKAHGISGGVTRMQLYRKMYNYIIEKL